MKNTFGQSIALTLFGESHGAAVGCVIDGLPAGIGVDEEKINSALALRRPSGETDTARKEPDEFKILSGVFGGHTTGTPISIVIPNVNTKSGDYSYGVARPSHADYAAHCKYHGFEDWRGGGHFSGRITAALVAAGAILSSALENVGVSVGTHILSCGGVLDREFGDVKEEINALKNKDFPLLDSGKKEEMVAEILAARSEGDSIGGITQTAIAGLPAGVGEPWFDSLEGVISHAIFSIGGIKGIEFGAGFKTAEMRGSQFNDPMCYKGGRVVTATNNNGGINGGISNGMPIIFNCAVKPTPSIYKPQQTVDFVKMEQTELQISGRHDPAIIRRICPVLNSVAALAVCDMLSLRFGTDYLAGDKS